jgi:tetratricopeptide (TPR) repeat protein
MSAASLLSSAHSFASVNEPDPAKRKEHAAKAKRWAERAAELVPGGAGDGALAVYYRMVERDAARALPFAQNEVRALPNDANGHNRVGACLAEFGRVQESLAAYDRALALDPLNVRVLHNRIIDFALLRRGPEFEDAAARSLELGGKNVDPNLIDDFRFRLTGELPRAIEELDATVPERQLLLWYGRRFAELLAASDQTVAQFAVLSPYSRWIFFRLRAGAYRQLGRAEPLATTAREMLACAETVAPDRGGDHVEYDQLRLWALAFGDQRDAALAAGRCYVEAASGPGQAAARWEREHELAQIYAWFGRKKECVEILTRLIRLPTLITVPYLKLAPDWDNVRDDPGFQALLADPRNSKPL